MESLCVSFLFRGKEGRLWKRRYRCLCPFSDLVCDLLPNGSPKARSTAEEYVSHNLNRALIGGHKDNLVPFLPKCWGTILWALRFLVVREIDCGNWLA